MESLYHNPYSVNISQQKYSLPHATCTLSVFFSKQAARKLLTKNNTSFHSKFTNILPITLKIAVRVGVAGVENNRVERK